MFSKIKQHYHWIIALVMLLQLAVIGGLGNNYNGLFVLPVTEELGISRASYSLAYTLKSLFSFVTTLLSGSLFLRFGNKKPMVAGLLFFCVGYTVLPLSRSAGMLAVGNLFLGVGDALCCTSAVSRIISTWFLKHKGTVWGAVSASTGIGGSILCLLLSNIIQAQGWRAAYFVSGCIVAAIALLVLLLVKSHPENMKLRPYGIDQAHTDRKANRRDDLWPGYEAGELRRQPVFYLALAGFFTVALALYLAFNNLVPHLQAQGLTQNEAVAQQSAMLIYLTLSKLLAGLLCDWLGPRLVTLLCSILAAVSLLLLSVVSPGFSASAAVFLYAFSLPMTTVLVPLLAAEVLGYRAQSSYHGLFMSMPLLGLLIASPISSAIFDAAGSYTPALLLAAAAAAVGAVLIAATALLSRRAKNASQAN